MPIQVLKAWAHDLDMVDIMLKDPQKKQLVGLVCSMNRISEELTLMSINKGFFVKKMKEKTLHNIVIKWNEFTELLKIKHDDSQKEFQRGSDHALMNFEGSSCLCLGKKKTKKGKNRSWQEKEDPDKISFWKRK